MSVSDEPAGNDRSDDRITQLESRLAFLENTIDVLAGELEAQQGETRILHKKLVGLHQQLESQQRDTGISDQPDEPPPHY